MFLRDIQKMVSKTHVTSQLVSGSASVAYDGEGFAESPLISLLRIEASASARGVFMAGTMYLPCLRSYIMGIFVVL